MSGHSKWNNIKHKKAEIDIKKATVFSRISRLIRAAVREGKSGDPASNPYLRPILDKAHEVNMPKSNIQKAIDVGLGVGANGRVEEVVYEAFGPGGVGMIIVALTDNRNRTTPEIRTILNKANGSLGGPNSVRYLFSRNQDGEYQCTMPFAIENPDQKAAFQSLVAELAAHEDVEEVFTALADEKQPVDSATNQ